MLVQIHGDCKVMAEIEEGDIDDMLIWEQKIMDEHPEIHKWVIYNEMSEHFVRKI